MRKKKPIGPSPFDKLLKYLFVIGISVLTYGSNGFAQTAEKTQFHYGLELGAGLSFTGYNTNLAFLVRYREHEAFIGPKWVFSDNYLIGENTFGVHLGYRYYLAQRKRVQTFSSINYQAVFTDPIGDQATGKNITNEFHFSYGLTFRLTSKIRIGNTVGLGGYTERLIDPITNERRSYFGYSTQLRIFVAYDFAKVGMK